MLCWATAKQAQIADGYATDHLKRSERDSAEWRHANATKHYWTSVIAHGKCLPDTYSIGDRGLTPRWSLCLALAACPESFRGSRCSSRFTPRGRHGSTFYACENHWHSPLIFRFLSASEFSQRNFCRARHFKFCAAALAVFRRAKISAAPAGRRNRFCARHFHPQTAQGLRHHHRRIAPKLAQSKLFRPDANSFRRRRRERPCLQNRPRTSSEKFRVRRASRHLRRTARRERQSLQNRPA